MCIHKNGVVSGVGPKDRKPQGPGLVSKKILQQVTLQTSPEGDLEFGLEEKWGKGGKRQGSSRRYGRRARLSHLKIR